MKKKTIVNSIAFAITLLFSIAIVTAIFNKNTFTFFNKEDNFNVKIKVYNFLLADKTRFKKLSDQYGEQRTKLEKMTIGYTRTLNPEEKAIYLKDNDNISKTYLSERCNADTSELPDDVREAWSKMVADGKSYLENWSKAKTEVREELEEKRNEEFKVNDEKYRRVLKKYGFELDQYGLVIEKGS